MKILKVSKIENFGIFKKFNWDSNLIDPTGKKSNQTYDFDDINIFYGRNYSGKTSLSKIIRTLETKTIPDKYDNPDFEITLSNGKTLNPKTLAEFTHPIHVYNTDFVKENLKFIQDETKDIESFSVTLGGDNKNILDSINKLKSELGSNEKDGETGVYLSLKSKKDNYDTAVKAHEDKENELKKLLSNKATGGAGSIKYQAEKFGDLNYDIKKLKEKDIPLVLESDYEPLTEIDKKNLEQLIGQSSKKEPDPISEFNINFQKSINAVNEILNTQVGQSKKIEELVHNGPLNKWVEEGLKYHSERLTCAFCSSFITEERTNALRQHFDEESKQLKERIRKGVDFLENTKKLLDIKLQKNQFYDVYHEDFEALQRQLLNLLASQENSFDALVQFLKNKEDNLFSLVEFIPPTDYSNNIQNCLKEINDIRNKHIELSERLVKDQVKAKTSLRLNHIHHFLQDINYTELKGNIENLKSAIQPCKDELELVKKRKADIDEEIKSQEKKLKSEEAACSRINEILKHDFGHKTLELVPLVSHEHQGKVISFEIHRDHSKAHNLSEGECSLIAFCYFLAKIQDDLEQNKEPIIWIDDPISSLDSNHIFFIFSLIEEKICKPMRYGQLFISTHNLEFLKYLKRISRENEASVRHYLIQRNDTVSTISIMPKYLKEYLTEFNFLFEQIYKCATMTQIDDSNFTVFYNYGNNARKFLEIYTFYKLPYIPTRKEDKKRRLEKFWGDGILKVFTDRILNEYSHLASVLERGGLIQDQPEMQKSAIAIIRKVQEDFDQYKALLESIGIDFIDDPLNVLVPT